MSSTETSLPSPAASEPLKMRFDNSYARLPANFFARVQPTPVRAPRLIKLNVALAEALGMDAEAIASAEGVQILAGNRLASGSEPIALAYAGHQFGHFVPQLGDGRANLLGEVIGRDGKRFDVQLKGSGPTPFSRRGDGRAALGPVLREYLVSEAMAALHVPTTRALAAVSTGEQVVRETMLPGAVLTRVAASHLRVGTFQYFAAQEDLSGLRRLADYAIERHYPAARQQDRPYRALLDGVIHRQASLIAQWMSLGFIHGVMNTDNMAISGETIDYGPCAFLEAYEPDKVYSFIDRQGRYAFSNQPHAAHWNLTRLAEALLPLLTEEESGEERALISAREALSNFGPQFEDTYLMHLRGKLGLTTAQAGDSALADDLFARMAAGGVDFTLFFRRLSTAAEDVSHDAKVRELFREPGAYDDWAKVWRNRLEEEAISAKERAKTMRGASPAVIPRNHRVEEMIVAAVTREDFQPFEDLLEAVTHPFDQNQDGSAYAIPAEPGQCVSNTFCGT